MPGMIKKSNTCKSESHGAGEKLVTNKIKINTCANFIKSSFSTLQKNHPYHSDFHQAASVTTRGSALQNSNPSITLTAGNHHQMALRLRLLVITLVMIIIIRIMPKRASAQPSDCTSTIISLSPCLNYITGGSDTPAVACCSQLAKVVQSDPKCLCLILGGGAAQFGVTVNQTKALALPNACSVQTPPVSRCKDDNSTPAPAPGSGPEATPGGASRGSYLQPMALPAIISVVFIVLAYFSMHYMSF